MLENTIVIKDQAEPVKQFQKDNAYYKSIIENNSYYVIKTDLEGNYTYMNPFFCKKLDVKAEDWLGKSSMGLIIKEDHPQCVETVMLCFATPNQSHWVNLRKPIVGGMLSTQWEFKLMTDDTGAPFDMLCVGHDITPLVKKQEELQHLVDVTAEQNKRLTNFTYIISHNIRSHVANISGIIDVSDPEDRDESKFALSTIKKSISSLNDTIASLNEIISIQADISLPVIPVNVFKEIEKTVESIAILVSNAGTSVNYNFDHNEQLTTNPAYFESIVLNLLTNAIKYKSPGVPLTIDISIDPVNKYQVLSFTDNGVGIDVKKNKERLFGMYNTFHGNKDAKGLGLYIIKTQIEAMKGKIEVESERDRGTTFKVYFLNDRAI